MTGFLALVRFVSVRHVRSAPVRSLLTLLGVALGVAMVVGMRASNQSVLHAFDEMTDRTAGKAELEVTGDESGVDQGLLDEVSARTDIVAHAAARIEQTSVLGAGPSLAKNASDAPLERHAEESAFDSGELERVLVFGVDFLGDQTFFPFATERGADVVKDPLAFLNDPEAILVSETFAETYHVKEGDKVRLRTARGMTEFHIESVLKETGKTRAFGGQLVVLFIDAAQLAFDRRGRVDRIDLALQKGVTVDAAKAELQKLVGARGRVDRPSKRAEELAKMARSFQFALEMQGMIAMFVGIFLIYNAVSVSVAQRRREIGILRSVGVTRRRVAGVFLAEALLLGILGGALGLPLGAAIARTVVAQFAPSVSQFYENISAPSPRITPSIAAAGVLLGFGATLLAGLVPAIRASRTSPVEALRRDLHSAARSPVPVRALVAVGLFFGGVAYLMTRIHEQLAGFGSLAALLVASACMAPAAIQLFARPVARIAERFFGLAARLGVDNVARELGRSSLATSALMLATAMSVTVASYTHSYELTAMEWVEQSIPADVFVTMGSPLVDRNAIPFAPDLAETVRKVDGVDVVDRVRSMTLTTHGLRVELLSLGSRTYLSHVAGKKYRRVVDGPDPLAVDILEKEPAVFVSENFAARTGLAAGATIVLHSPTGAHAFKIAAVVVDYSSDQGWLLIDRKWFVQFWNDDRVEAVEVYLRKGADPLAVAAAIRRELHGGMDSGGMFVSTNAAIKDEARHTIEQTFEVSRASEIIALVVAVLGVIGTMLAAVLDRTREIGVLRAIGATRSQVGASVMAEAGFLGLSAALLGVVASLPATLVFIKVVGVAATGWNVPFRVPLVAVLRVTTSVVAFAALAGLVPGYRASRLLITRALAYE
jgi:putative ABC transport system permease protein